jgi:hypothetical protein
MERGFRSEVKITLSNVSNATIPHNNYRIVGAWSVTSPFEKFAGTSETLSYELAL